MSRAWGGGHWGCVGKRLAALSATACQPPCSTPAAHTTTRIPCPSNVRSTPSIPAADPISQTAATIVLNAPPGVTAQYFLLKLCPQPSGTCLERTCPDIICNVKSLKAGAK